MDGPSLLAPCPSYGGQIAHPTPLPGEVFLWESWLRHEVPVNMADDDRISVSFNYGWG